MCNDHFTSHVAKHREWKRCVCAKPWQIQYDLQMSLVFDTMNDNLPLRPRAS